MTVIAWDGVTLAADKLMSDGCSRDTVTKIYRVQGRLVGVTGVSAAGRELLAWFRDGAVPAKYPEASRKGDEGANLLVVSRENSLLVRLYHTSPYPIEVEDRCVAVGSGYEGALIAMACGKTAAEAVELVSRFNIRCGGGVDTLTLE